MATKKMNELTELTEVASDDLVMVFDASETGSEKTKKYPVQSLKSNLTSMDPSSFGNWVKIAERSGSIDGSTWSSSFGAPSLLNYDKIMVRLVAESIVDTTANFYVAVGEYDGTTDGTGSNYSQTAGLPDNRMLIHGAGSFVTIESIYDTATKTITSLVTGGTGSTAERVDQTIVYHGSKDGSMLSVQCYGGTSSVYNGKIEFFGWQEVKPIELHSYELVKEYNLNNETLSDTFDWDGEADPECRIVAAVSAGGVWVRPNGDDGNNYTYGGWSQDGAVMTAGSGQQNGFPAGTGQPTTNVFEELNIYLKNTGKPRLARRETSQYNSTNTDFVKSAYSWYWSNTADDVTSITVASTSTLSGNIRIYKLAKTHLFNQTIYNDLTLNVATTGSDTTGDGTSQKPFASLVGALAWLKNKTINTDVSVTIQLADGTYNLNSRADIECSRGVIINGNSITPSNVVISVAAGVDGIFYQCGGHLSIKNLKLYQTDKSETALYAAYGSSIYANNCIFEGFHAAVDASYGGSMRLYGCTLDSNNYGLYAARNGVVSFQNGSIIDNALYGARANFQGRIMIENSTLSGNGTNINALNDGIVTVV